MDNFPSPPPPRPAPTPVSRLPMLIGVLVALVVLVLAPRYLEWVEYSKMRGEVRAIDEGLKDELGKKIGSLGKAFVPLATKAAQSVVHIDTKQTQDRRPNGIFGGVAPYEAEGEASGVIVETDGKTGYILTNYHVVEDATQVSVTLSDGTRIADATVIATDEAYDLAVIKISASNLTAAEWGNSDELEVGEMVLAIGNPFGLDRSVTFGIVSAKNRREVGNGKAEFLQSDAAVNPGNSGGPLINMAGKVVGINTAIVGPAYQGISFSLPSNVAHEVYDQLKAGQTVVRGYLGVGPGPVTDELAQRLGLTTRMGAVVMSVKPNSPADKAGIRLNDILLSFDGQVIEDPSLLRILVARTKVNATVPIVVLRDGQKLTLQAKIVERPKQLRQ